MRKPTAVLTAHQPKSLCLIWSNFVVVIFHIFYLFFINVLFQSTLKNISHRNMHLVARRHMTNKSNVCSKIGIKHQMESWSVPIIH